MHQAVMPLFGAIDVDGEGDGDWVARVSPAAMLETFDSYDASSPLTGSTKNGDLKQKLFDQQPEVIPSSVLHDPFWAHADLPESLCFVDLGPGLEGYAREAI